MALLPVRTQSSLGYFRSDTSAGLAAHEAQGLAYLAIGKNVDEGRLSELNGESLFEGIVEDGVSGFVVEVGEDYGVFLGEGRRGGGGRGGTRAPVEAGRDERDYDHGGGKQDLPARAPGGPVAEV